MIKVDTKDLPDGSIVRVLAHEGDETFELEAAQDAELLAAIAEADRGEFVDGISIFKYRRQNA